MQSALEFGARSDAGRVRENNEDNFGAAPELGLFVLSDGMGGCQSGEIASRIAVESILEHCREAEARVSLPMVGDPISGASDASNRLASAVRVANRAIGEAAAGNPDRSNMGATVVAVRIAGDRISIVHVGDSRAYRFRSGAIEQLTEDHSFVAEQVRLGRLTPAEAQRSSMQNVLLRALGPDPEVEVEVDEELFLEGDTILLASDGLTRELSDAQIAAVLAEQEDASAAARRLVELANQAGGGDNITVIVVRHAAKHLGKLRRMGRLGKWLKGSGDPS
jgi:protein phosphatase